MLSRISFHVLIRQDHLLFEKPGPQVQSQLRKYHSLDKRLTDLVMMIRVRQTEDYDMLLHVVTTDMKLHVVEIEIDDITADDVDKVSQPYFFSCLIRQRGVTVLTSIDAATVLAGGIDVSTGSGFIPTVGPPATVISTGSEVGLTASPIPTRKKGQGIYEEQQEKEDMRMNEQIARDAEVAMIHAEEELQGMIDNYDITSSLRRGALQNVRNEASGSGPARGQDVVLATRECTFVGFMKCNPTAFCEGKKVRFAAATLQGPALTWWNAKVATRGLETMNRMPWTEMKHLMTRFNELALMCPRMVEPKRVKVDAYIWGLTDNIKGEVTSSRPANLNEAMCMAHKLMDHKVQAGDERILEGKKRKWESFQNRISRARAIKGITHVKLCRITKGKETREIWLPPLLMEGFLCVYDVLLAMLVSVRSSAISVERLGTVKVLEKGHTRNRCPKKVKQEEIREVCGRAYAIKDDELKGPNVVTDKSKEKRMEDMTVIRDFPKVFHEELPRLPLPRQVEFRIDLVLGAAPVIREPSILAPSEMKELSVQLQELLEKGFIHPRAEVSYHNIGAPSYQCVHCNASMWYGERINKGNQAVTPSFSLCCQEGKLRLPKFNPKPLRNLLNYNDPATTRFRDQINVYNNMFSFTYFGARIDHSINNSRGVYTFRVNGQSYHIIGSLFPKEGTQPRYAQLWFFDTRNEVRNCMGAFIDKDNSDTLDATCWISIVQ
nr:hypothetical protein [Tanacetum cinerariifolium]